MSQNPTKSVYLHEGRYVNLTKKFFITKWEGMNEVGEGETVPMSKKLNDNQFVLLSAIAMFQGEGGICTTTHSQLEDVLPLTRKIIGKTLESLIDFRYAGKPVLERSEVIGPSRRKQWRYKLLPNPLFSIYGESKRPRVPESE